jgi:hypothetical protein
MKTPTISSSKALEDAARFQDIRARAARVQPVVTAPEILDTVGTRPIQVRANRDPFGGRYDDTL